MSGTWKTYGARACVSGELEMMFATRISLLDAVVFVAMEILTTLPTPKPALVKGSELSLTLTVLPAGRVVVSTLNENLLLLSQVVSAPFKTGRLDCSEGEAIWNEPKHSEEVFFRLPTNVVPQGCSRTQGRPKKSLSNSGEAKSSLATTRALPLKKT